MLFLVALFLVGVLSGATAAISGFGIGSLLTPLLASQVGTGMAVAAVAIPHAIATALRGWRLRKAIAWPVLAPLRRHQRGGKSRRRAAASPARRSGAHERARRAADPDGDRRTDWLGVTGHAVGTGRSASRTALWTLRRARRKPGRPAGRRLVRLQAPAGHLRRHSHRDRTPGGRGAGARLSLEFGPGAVLARHPDLVATVGVVVGTMAGERVLLGLTPERFRLVVSALIGLLGLGLLTGVLTVSSPTVRMPAGCRAVGRAETVSAHDGHRL